MKVILRKNVEKLGEMGDIVTVAEGFARNFLIPYKVAFASTPDAERQIETLTRRRSELEAKRIEAARTVADEIKGSLITILARADGNKLYGAIHEKNIADAATEKLKYQISPKMVILTEAIKETGEYTVKLMLEKNVETDINVVIEGEAVEETPDDAASEVVSYGTEDDYDMESDY